MKRRTLLSLPLLAISAAAAPALAAPTTPRSASEGGSAEDQGSLDPLRWPQTRFRKLAARLRAAADVLGYGNFNLVSFDEVRVAAQRTRAGAFTAGEERDFEAVFQLDPQRIGFFGERVVHDLSFSLPRERLVAVRGTPHLLYPQASELFDKARAKIGNQLIVTSGVRGVPKQLLLFLQHAARDSINPTRHSVAPPGFSYHAVGDMDVGDARLGAANFTSAFARSDIYRQLQQMPEIRFRYPENNQLGVIFEPWHIAVV